jgi:hypothetical protein
MPSTRSSSFTALHEREQIALARRHRQIVREGFDTDLRARFALVSHVHRRGRVLSHLHDGEPGLAPELRCEGAGSQRRFWRSLAAVALPSRMAGALLHLYD